MTKQTKKKLLSGPEHNSRNISNTVSQLMKRFFGTASSSKDLEKGANNYCCRCGKEGVVNSHTIPRSYLKSISEGESEDSTNKMVVKSGFARNPLSGIFEIIKQAPATASTYPLFCHASCDSSSSCEGFYGENGERVPPKTDSTDFFKAIMCFCERIAYAKKYTQDRLSDTGSDSINNYAPLFKQFNHLAYLPEERLLLAEGESPLRSSLEKVMEKSKEEALVTNFIFIELLKFIKDNLLSPDITKGPSLRYVIFENQLMWHMSDVSFIEITSDAPDFGERNFLVFFCFTMKVVHDGETKDSLIFIPFHMLISPSDGQGDNGGEVSFHHVPVPESNLDQEAIESLCMEDLLAYGITRPECWFSPSLEPTLGRVFSEINAQDKPVDYCFEQEIVRNLVSPENDSRQELWVDRSFLHNFVMDQLNDLGPSLVLIQKNNDG